MQKLSPKQQRFAEEYARGATGVEAALAAGYSQKQPAVAAAKLLKQAHVAEAIAKIRREAQERTAIDAAWVIEQLVDNVKIAKRREDIHAANRALELLGKNIGMFSDRLKLDGPPGSQIQAVLNVSIGQQ